MSSAGPQALTVSQLTAVVRGAVAAEARLEDVLVEGEVSNVRIPPSGHLYFTLRDRTSSVRCVCWRTSVQRIPFHPENGLTVVAHGRVDVYESEGAYQLYVDRLDPAGVGALALAVEQTKRRLQQAGLFDPALKRPLPPMPRRIAVVTSPTGAAVRDVLNVLRRRAPQVGVLIVPTPVQGEGADIAIAQAIDQAGRARDVDLVLLVRGGGSYEDLFSFQSEPVCRAIRACRRPVVCGVGHETDTTLADFAADRRAPTPSAAAELAVPDAASLVEELETRRTRLRRALRQEMSAKRTGLDRSLQRLERVSPSVRLPQLRQALDGRTLRLRSALLRELAAKRRRLDAVSSRLELNAPGRRIPAQREGLRRRRSSLEAALQADLARRRAALGTASARLEALSPRRVLERGYSLTLDVRTGAVVDDAARLAAGMEIDTLLRHGRVRSRVEAASGGSSTATDEQMYDGAPAGDLAAGSTPPDGRDLT
ncbi:MAG TPA: exodeoxyribonuclease VII large subunit [Candidatus Dormibacteraeota bacterium]|nr:exodeoxyribonuclease VII large subunit [Candidatus Dormibacteraeota bacterium]